MFFWNEGAMVPCDAPSVHDDRWFDLEALLAWRVPVGYGEGQPVYGGYLEPGYHLRSLTWIACCPECKRYRLECEEWEQLEGGSLNTYYRHACDACNYEKMNCDGLDGWDC